MVELGEDAGVATSAFLTNMNVPLGLAIGNANEVRESVEVLAGGGPADVVELTLDPRPRDAGPRRAAGSGCRGRAAGRSWRDGCLAGHDLGAGRRPGRAAADGEGVRDRRGGPRRRARRAAGPAVRHRGLAPRRGPGPQGGPGAARRRHRSARQAGRHGARRAAALHDAHGRRGALRPRHRGARKAPTGSAK